MSDNYVGRAPNAINVMGDYSPIGAINWFHAPPDGSWLQLNGQTISKATYADLWAWAQAFITTDQTLNPGLYLSVDANNFKVPNFSGLFVRGTGQVDATHVAAAVGVKQVDTVGPHTHATPYRYHTPDFNDGTGNAGATPAWGARTDISANTGTVETRPANVALVPCVKALKAVLTQGTQFQSDWKLIDFKDAATSATLDFTTGITSEYDSLMFVIRGVTPVTSDTGLVMRYSTDAGATWDSATANYYEAFNIVQLSANNPTTRTGIPYLTVSQACSNTTVDHGVNGTVNIYAPSLVGKAKHHSVHSGHWRGGTSHILFTSNGMYYANSGAAPAVTGVRFLFVSGNIASGRILMYGLRNVVQSALLPSYATAALQADQELATSTDKFITPAVQKNHPSAAKFWIKWGNAGNILASYNVASLVKNAAGDYTINFTVPFSSADYAVTATSMNGDASGGTATISMVMTQSAAAVRIGCFQAFSTSAKVDHNAWHVVGFGDQ